MGGMAGFAGSPAQRWLSVYRWGSERRSEAIQAGPQGSFWSTSRADYALGLQKPPAWLG